MFAFKTLQFEIQYSEVQATRSTKKWRRRTRSTANDLVTGMRTKTSFNNIKNRAIPERDDQGERQKLNINIFPNQEVSIEPKIRQLNATGKRKKVV